MVSRLDVATVFALAGMSKSLLPAPVDISLVRLQQGQEIERAVASEKRLI